MIVACINQHLSNILSSVNQKARLRLSRRKALLIKKVCISLNSGLWSNLLRKTAITTTFYLPKGESICIRKK